MNDKENIRIALAEDNIVSRKSFLEKAQLIPEWKIIFTANNGNECMEKLGSLKEDMMPQIVFMDIEMPGVNGITTIAMAKALHPQVSFIALTVFDDDDKIFEAIKAGASGYLLKHEEHTMLKDAVTGLLEHGGAPMSPAIARKTLQLLSKVVEITKQGHDAMPEHLTTREKEILQYTVSGWDAKRIAAKLQISTLTVRKHIAHIYQKLHVQSKAEVINMAHKNNWLK
jgi:DNA-binding NarL/FixJ family response regulator